MKKKLTDRNPTISAVAILAIIFWALGCGGGEPSSDASGSETSDGDVEVLCEQGCLINEICHDSGTENPENSCLICDPNQDHSAWSDNDGEPCSDGLFCNGDDSCSGGECSVHEGFSCEQDGSFCNGEEVCSEGTDSCVSSGDPCEPTDELCFEVESRCCEPNAIADCDEEGNVIWFDSCGRPTGRVGKCTGENFTCREGVCLCADGWSGGDCEFCTVFVNGETGSDGNVGGCWEQAFATVQAALQFSESRGCEIWVAAGTYYPGEELVDRESTFQLQSGVSLYGGFAGTETLLEERDIEANETILSGDIDHNGELDDGNVYHVVTGANDTLIDGFTIRDGNANVRGTINHTWYGGGMFNNSRSPTVNNCIFINNFAGYGSGMANRNSSPTVTNCTFTENRGRGGMFNENSSAIVTDCRFVDNRFSGRGGGMYNISASPEVTDCDFIRNSGGIYNDESSPIVTNCRFTENSADLGGGITNWDSSSIIVDCTFSDNSAGRYGGALFTERTHTATHDSPLIVGCTFTGNSAELRGGGMYNSGGTYPTVVNCVFENNSTETVLLGSGGGGMYNSGASPTIINSIFWRNTTAHDGGGMYNSHSTTTVTNCTFINNSAAFSGGGMYGKYEAFPTVTNCIFWGNTAPTGPQLIDDETSTTTVTSSNIQGGYSGVGNIDENPLFTDPDGGDFTLQDGSPCIDSGDSSVLPFDDYDLDDDGDIDEFLPVDLDNNPRVADGDGDGSEQIDMGAYEL